MMTRPPHTSRPNEAIVRLEPFVFLGIILLVWLLSSLGSWLRQEIERQSPSVPDADAPADHGEDLLSPECGSVMPDEATQGAHEEPIAVSRIVAEERRPRPASGRRRYRGPKAVRDGIVMITVFGSCVALDRRTAPWLREE